MKKLTIGRGDDCDIYVSDPKGLVSRKHAILKIDPSGKMQITDVSKNGTFINGVRIPAHVPQKVTRKDIVVFANSSKLDWNDVPETGKWIRIGLMVICGLIIVILALIAAGKFINNNETSDEISDPLPAIMAPTASETPSRQEPRQAIVPNTEPTEITTSKPETVIPANEQKSGKKRKQEVKQEPKAPTNPEQPEASEPVTPEKDNKAPGGD